MDTLSKTRLLKIWAKSTAIIPSWHIDFRNKEVYEKLKEGYQILLQNTPESTLFEEYLREESNQLLDAAIAIVEAAEMVETVKEPDYLNLSWSQFFATLFPTKSYASLMTYEVR